MRRSVCSILFALGALTSLVACEPSTPNAVHHSRAYTETALSLASPPPDRARIVIFSGMWERDGKWMLHGIAASLRINSIDLGVLDKLQVMVFDVAPGEYSLTWWDYKNPFSLRAKSVPAVHDLAGGTVLMLENDVSGSNYIFQPVHGSLYLTTERRASPDFEVVRPASCPPAICRP